MEPSYHYRKKRKIKRRLRWALPIFVTLVLVLAGLIAHDVYRSQSTPKEGEVQSSQLSFDNKGPMLTISEPTFTMQLPGDWRETKRTDTPTLYGITWQATKAKEDNRYLTLYLDRIPTTLAFNKLLPVESIGNKLRHGSISDNCAAYTQGGSFEASQAVNAKVTPAKWEEVTFLCDLPKVFDNVVGTSSKEGINTVSVEGTEAGKHRYFFVYTDHNAHPNYDIFTDAVESFTAR